ncbi:MAG: PIN domain-containing protein [Verrucomicrobiia bacterium]
MALILDSNLFIAAERSRETGRLSELLSQIPSEYQNSDALISVITASELLIGVRRAVDDKIRQRRQAYVDAILDQFSVISIDLRVAREHSRLVAELLAKGEPIGTHDSWIAATTIAYGHALVTANAREFRRVEGLNVIELRL